MSDDLVAFLNARLDEDDEIASTADRGELHQEAHIARHDPARVLREVEADRKLLAVLAAACEEVDDPRFDPVDSGYAHADGEYVGLLRAVKIRASVHSDHPEYRPEWKP